MSPTKKYRLTKITHYADEPHPNFIDEGYTAVGFSLLPEVGKCFVLIHKISRVFSSSPVTQITRDGFKTKNSQYKLEEIPEMINEIDELLENWLDSRTQATYKDIVEINAFHRYLLVDFYNSLTDKQKAEVFNKIKNLI